VIDNDGVIVLVVDNEADRDNEMVGDMETDDV
jgi:hypothetical protein